MKRIIYPSLVILVAIFSSLSLSAQYNWQHTGPESLGNRTRSILYDAQGNLLAASGGGGLWKSTNEGVSWFKVESYDGNPAVTSLVRNGNTIYLGTGEIAFYGLAIAFQSEYDPSSPEGMFGYIGHPGQGVYISKDNGVTWSNSNATFTQFPTSSYDGPFIGIQKLAFGPQGNRLFIATREGLYYSDDPELGTVQKSQGSEVFESTAIFDVEVSGDVIFAGSRDSLYISEDRGATFRVANVSSRPISFVRVEVAIAPSNPDVVYVAGARSSSVSQLNGIWRSNDRGKTWTQFAPQGGPGFSPLGNTARDAFTLAVKPDDENGVIIAGNAWFTYDEVKGWTQTASHTNPTSNIYIPRPIYTLTFDPNDPNTFFIGTGNKITYSNDRGQTFQRRSAGYGGTLTNSVTSIGYQNQESIISGTPVDGTIQNSNFWRQPYDPETNPSGPPTLKGFGIINSEDNGNVTASSLFAGSVIIQGSDKGVLRSNTFGSTFEPFYGPPLNSDTLERPSTGERDSVVAAPLNGIMGGSIFIDRSGAAQAPGGMVDNGKTSPTMQFVLDEVIPEDHIAPPNITSLDELKKYPNKDSLQKLAHYLFYASSRYIWICNYALGNPEGLTPRWDRITNNLTATSGDEYFTAMDVTNDGEHTLFVGTSKGKLWRIKGSTDFETYDGTTGGAFVSDIISNAPGAVVSVKGRWLSDIAVDPTNPNRVAITFAGYGGTKPVSYVWLINNALTSPVYSFFALAPKEPVYSCEFVEYQPDPNDPAKEIALFIGTESGLYSTTEFTAAAAWTAEFPDSYGSIPVHDIYVRKHRAVVIDEENSDYVLQQDNTLFAATLGYGVWYTTDARFTARNGEEEEPGLEVDAYASQLFPNPSNTTTTVRVDVPVSSTVQVNLYTLEGRKVLTVANEEASEGRHDYEFDTRSLNPGIYLVEIRAEGEGQVHHKTLKAVITR